MKFSERTKILFLLAIFLCFVLTTGRVALIPQTYATNPFSMIQSKACNANAFAQSCAFTSNIGTNNITFASLGETVFNSSSDSYVSLTSITISDTRALSYTCTSQIQQVPGVGPEAGRRFTSIVRSCWAFTNSNSGADTITITPSWSAGATLLTQPGIFIQQISCLGGCSSMTAAFAGINGSGTTGYIASISNTNFNSGDYIFGTAQFSQGGATAGCTHAPTFTCFTQSSGYDIAQYNTNWGGGSSTVPLNGTATPGTGTMSGWNYVVVAIATPGPITGNTVTVNWIGNNVTVTITLVKQTGGTALGIPNSNNSIIASYIINKNSTTLQLADGSNTFIADGNTVVTISGISTKSSNYTRWCLLNCLPSSFNVGVGSISLSYGYWIQENKSTTYSVGSGSPAAGTNPTFGYQYFSTASSNPLALTPTYTWVDNSTNLTPLNPWFSGGRNFIPTPSAATVASYALQNFVYNVQNSSIGNNCVGAGHNTTALWQNGCVIPAFIYTFANVLTLPGTYALMFVSPISIAVFIKSRALLLTIEVMVLVGGGLLYATNSLPPYASMLILFITAAGFAATGVSLIRKESI